MFIYIARARYTSIRATLKKYYFRHRPIQKLYFVYSPRSTNLRCTNGVSGLALFESKKENCSGRLAAIVLEQTAEELLNGIIIVDHGSRREESNRMLELVANLFAKRFETSRGMPAS